MNVLVTRPHEDAAHTAARLARLGHAACVSPVSLILPSGAGPASLRHDAVVATSANAFRLASPELLGSLGDKRIFTVGDHTAAEARGCGLSRVTSAGADQRALSALIQASLPAGSRLLYLAGRDRKPGLEAGLRSAGMTVETVEIYHAENAPCLTREAQALLASGQIRAVLHYSNAAAAGFAALAEAAGLTRAARALRHCCISTDAAAPLRRAAFPGVEIAAHPDESSLLSLLQS